MSTFHLTLDVTSLPALSYARQILNQALADTESIGSIVDADC